MNSYSSSHFGFNMFGVTEREAQRNAAASSPYRTAGTRSALVQRPTETNNARERVENIINKSYFSVNHPEIDISTIRLVYEHVSEEDCPELLSDVLRGLSDTLGDTEEYDELKYLIDQFEALPVLAKDLVIDSLGRKIEKAQNDALMSYMERVDEEYPDIDILGRRDEERRTRRRGRRVQERAQEHARAAMVNLDDLMAGMTVGGPNFGRRQRSKSGANKKRTTSRKKTSFGRRKRQSGSKKKARKV